MEKATSLLQVCTWNEFLEEVKPDLNLKSPSLPDLKKRNEDAGRENNLGGSFVIWKSFVDLEIYII